MANGEPVNERPLLPSLHRSDAVGVSHWSSDLIRQLITVFQQYGYRINQSLSKDGTVVPTAPVPLQSILAADLPPAADWEGSIVYVSDGSAGEKFRGSDGTDWVNLG